MMLGFFEQVGKTVYSSLRHIGSIYHLLAKTLYWTFLGTFKKKPISRKNVFDQMVFIGIKSILIVSFVSIFTGVVLAMQSAYQLDKFGAVKYVASLVAISLARELGPVLVALVVAGRAGAAITAELATMKVTEQIEALTTMALDPVRFLVAPRFLALIIMLPCLTIIGDLIGMFGGFLIGILSLKLTPGIYIDVTLEFLAMKDVYTGLFKSFIFGAIIALVGCYQGLITEGGAEGVGKSTTISVVTSFILIIFSDAIMTMMFYFSQV